MAGVPMTTQQFKDAYEPVLIDKYQLGETELPTQWKKYMTVTSSRKLAIENQVMNYGLGIAQEKAEGTEIQYQGGGQSYKATFLKKTYTNGFAVTEEAMEFDEHLDILAEYGAELPRSMNEAKELVCVALLNNAFSSSFTGGDAVSLINAAHPIQPGVGPTSYSNLLANPSDLSETALEQMAIQVSNAVDQTGRPIELKPMRLLCANENMFNAQRIIKSVLQTDSNTNNINAVKDMDVLPEGYVPLRRFTNTRQWFIQTNAKNGLQLKYGWKPKVKYEGAFDSGNMRGKATENYAVAWLNPRCLFGTAGF